MSHIIKRVKVAYREQATRDDRGQVVVDSLPFGKATTRYAVAVQMPKGYVSEWTADEAKAGKFDDATACAVVDFYKGGDKKVIGEIAVVSEDEPKPAKKATAGPKVVGQKK